MRFRSAKHLRWYIGTVLVLAFFYFIGWLRPVVFGVRYVLDPIINKTYRTVGQANNFVWKWRADIYEKLSLSEVVRERDILRARTAMLEAENAGLRKQLNFPLAPVWSVIGADVIAKSADVSKQTLLLNRGSEDGVVTQAVVITENRILIGEIISVEAHRSVVRLLNDRQSRVGALLALNARPVGIVEGGYGLGIRLTLVPPEEVISVGDIIVTNDATEFMPRGLVVGTVVSVGRETYEPFQHALLRPALPYEAVQTVGIIVKK